jgi:hypothetical protein
MMEMEVDEQELLKEKPKGLIPIRVKKKHKVPYKELNRRKQQQLTPFFTNHRIDDYFTKSEKEKEQE